MGQLIHSWGIWDSKPEDYRGLPLPHPLPSQRIVSDLPHYFRGAPAIPTPVIPTPTIPTRIWMQGLGSCESFFLRSNRIGRPPWFLTGELFMKYKNFVSWNLKNLIVDRFYLLTYFLDVDGVISATSFSSRENIMTIMFSLELKLVHVYSFYFTKAYDTVRHDTLMNKMAQLSIADNIYNWIKELFQEHFHCTRYAGECSTVASVKASVIQCSGLGPASFIVTASDLHHKCTW